MVNGAAQQVADSLLDTVGDGLRTVVIVNPNDFELVYLDDDLKRSYSRDTFNEVVDTFRLDEPLFSPGIEGYPVGERRAIVHYHANAFVLQFPYSETETILISVTREIGRDLLGFIENCREMVKKEMRHG